MPSDLLATRQRILSGEWTASRAVDDAIARARSPAGRDAFVFPRFDEARAEAARFDRETALAVRRPLAGLPFSVKDLFDVEGQVTAAGSRVLADQPAATADCPAVARLRAAGGSLIGRTHMVEFAFSGMGTNPHFATPAAWDGRHDQSVGSPRGAAGARGLVIRRCGIGRHGRRVHRPGLGHRPDRSGFLPP
jgi:aspartyl-tRNA(Asn)/glutamyl-tRNA(Gln) amidotransferase subunit A